jgi:hypothetical protein
VDGEHFLDRELTQCLVCDRFEDIDEDIVEVADDYFRSEAATTPVVLRPGWGPYETATGSNTEAQLTLEVDR